MPTDFVNSPPDNYIPVLNGFIPSKALEAHSGVILELKLAHNINRIISITYEETADLDFSL